MNTVWGNKVRSARCGIIAIALCAACSAEPADRPASEQAQAVKGSEFKVVATPQRKGEVMTPEQPKRATLDVRMQGFVDAARADLAEKLTVTVSQIELVDARYVTWRDSSLGCPQPGHQYTQALVNGTRITFRSAGQTYYYHGGKNKPPRLCEKPAAKQPLPYGAGDA